MAAPTVLIVEDEPTLLTIVGDFLQENGMTTLLAGNGMEALAVLLGGSPVDVILLDWGLPLMSGAEFLLEMKLRLAPPYPAVLIVSSTPEETLPLERSDYVAYLRKPVHPANLLQAVRRWEKGAEDSRAQIE